MEGIESLLILMVVVWVAGKIFRALSLPVIFGELLGGIIVGPLIFNVIDPHSELIISLAELGVFFLMLHTGLESDANKLFKASKKSFGIAALGLVIPFVLGTMAAEAFGFTLYESLFIATGISATAIAVSVRILKDCKIRNTRVADTVLASAVISDIVLLVAFSIILTLVETGVFDFAQFAIMILKVTLFFGVVIIGGHKLRNHTGNFYKDKGFTLTLIVALTLGLIAELIGLHLIIGAFLAGLFISEEVVDKKVFDKIEDRVYGLSYSFLGPIFFATLAFSLDFSGLIGEPWLLITLFLIAFFGKFIGSSVGAYLQKIKAGKSILIGLVMNSRGAVDLIIASIGLQVGIIDETVFSILITIAFASTLFAILGVRVIKKRLHLEYGT